MCVPIHAQQQVEIGLSAGPTHFYGDLGNEAIFPLNSTRFGSTLTMRHFLNNPLRSGIINPAFSMELRLSHHRIGYDETDAIRRKEGFELRNYGRGLSFRTDVLGGSVHLTFTHYPNKYIPLHRQKYILFGFIGAGVYYADPRADLFYGDAQRYYFWRDGTVRDRAESGGSGNVIQKDGIFETRLRDWYTEGQGVHPENDDIALYPPWHIGFPMGFGVRRAINRELTISAEFSVYNFTTDYLDDVSAEYSTFQQIQENFPNDPYKQSVAMYISDPTGFGTNGVPGPATSRRGNPFKNDVFTYLGIELAYKFKGKIPNPYLR
jgi:hypothetical protein